MRIPVLPFMLKPAGWLIAGLLAVAALMLLVQTLGFRWDPFDRTHRRLEAAEVRAEMAEAHAATCRLEVAGAAVQARRLETHHRQALDLGRATARAEAGARSSNDAEQPLDQARAARLAGHDRELCRLAPGICAAPEAEPAVGGHDTLPAGPTAGTADPD